ncbi:30S ribosome-binding factor RbfA [Pararhizobium mangrovi]|uniref:Ribosome-binding factor A n=1 Tax=Pararhizobium mangrovi TaxID=2590452 RepID=A0A506TX70_9HYPH|nr:30S ribosome-binding factor RbfA [Pararhizobium mangrovi]TPW26110.1 30S ribosome-binding factor RbfA [Pararhizobium mangrovi]
MSRKSSARAPSQRQLRVGEQVRAALTDVLQRGEVRDPVLEDAIVSVLEVRMSPDMKVATAYVTPLGENDHGAIVEALNRNVRFIRGRVTPALKQMRSVPSLRFRDDTSFENFRHIDELLRSPEVAQDLDEAGEDE